MVCLGFEPGPELHFTHVKQTANSTMDYAAHLNRPLHRIPTTKKDLSVTKDRDRTEEALERTGAKRQNRKN